MCLKILKILILIKSLLKEKMGVSMLGESLCMVPNNFISLNIFEILSCI